MSENGMVYKPIVDYPEAYPWTVFEEDIKCRQDYVRNIAAGIAVIFSPSTLICGSLLKTKE